MKIVVYSSSSFLVQRFSTISLQPSTDERSKIQAQLQLSKVIYERPENRIIINLKSRQCAVCAMDKPWHEFQGNYSDACLHTERSVCDACVYENTKYLVENTNIFDEEVTCPEQNCNAAFNFNTIRHILLSTGKNHIVFEQYNERLIHRRLEQMTEFVWCAHGCGSGQLHDLESSSSVEVICIKCQQRTCFTHRTVWHAGLTCAEYDLFRNELPDDASSTWLENNTKRCPQCRWYIEKNSGCDQMKCRRCQHKFCWECLADYNMITHIGKSQHQPWCSHYKVNRYEQNIYKCSCE